MPINYVFAVFRNRADGHINNGVISVSDIDQMLEKDGTHEVLLQIPPYDLKQIIGRIEAGKADFTLKHTVALVWKEDEE